MGRWAQRRLSGGGTPTLNHMTQATIDGTDFLRIDYASDIAPGDVNAAAYNTAPGGLTPTGIGQDTPLQLTLDFGENVTGQTTITYAGTTIGIRTPQTIPIT